MRVPLSWLKEYVALDVDPTDRAAVRALGEVLDGLGLVVERIESVGDGLGGVILARVVEIAAIEGADRVRLVKVDTGAGELIDVVCGAWNFGIGDVVPFAPIGVTLPNEMTIAARKMRGVVSNGMLCSANELRLADDHEGLLILAKTGSAHGDLPIGSELGTEIADHLGVIPDVVFDLAIEPNRPDALSIVGVARDLAAKLQLDFQPPKPVVHEASEQANQLATVEVIDSDLCPRLVASVITGVANITSPPEIARRLTLAGMRPVNAIVDASNYVMLELGQPTHPYDLAQLYGRGLRVRRARPDESLVTLDGVRRMLGRSSADDLLICDTKDIPVGLAGVMGGESSEISSATTEVLLEVATFDGIAIGRTATAQGLRSEASTRFWRGTDPEGLERAADRFCELVVAAHLAKGLTPPLVAAGHLESTPVLPPRRVVSLRTSRVNSYLGTQLSEAAMIGLLAPLGFEVEVVEGHLNVQIPGYRGDVSREVDLIEEIARHFGYDQIVATSRRSPFVGQRTDRQELRRSLRSLFCGLGASEAWSSSIVDPAEEHSTGSTVRPVELSNPIVVNEVALRSHLLGGLCSALRYNESHRNSEIRLFEIGNVFALSDSDDERPQERELAAVVFASLGDDASTAWSCWRALVDSLQLDDAQFELTQALPGESLALEWLSTGVHPTRSGQVHLGDLTVGVIGEIDPAVQELLGLAPRRLGWLVVDVEILNRCSRREKLAQPVSHFPSADVDLAFVLSDEIPAVVLERAIRDAAGELGESVRLVDTYRGRGVHEGSRSLSYRVRFCASDKTLTEQDISAARTGIISTVESCLPATLRS